MFLVLFKGRYTILVLNSLHFCEMSNVTMPVIIDTDNVHMPVYINIYFCDALVYVVNFGSMNDDRSACTGPNLSSRAPRPRVDCRKRLSGGDSLEVFR